MMDCITAMLLALIEGATEFLPISSTGHLILADEVLGFAEATNADDFAKRFIVLIQLPAIMSVAVYFWRDLWPMGAKEEDRAGIWTLWGKVLLAFVPAAILGFLFDDFIETKLFNPLTVSVALVVGGILLVVLERIPRTARFEEAVALPWGVAFMIGCFQCLAMIPGTSRSAATIIGAMLLGTRRKAAAEFSFFLALPTMLGATGYTLLKHGLGFTPWQWLLAGLASVVSFLVAYGTIAFFMSYIRTRSFALFGYYRIVVGALILWWWYS
jgi:undecaprenyl-diphosphatase